MDITEKIKSFEDACQALNLDPTALPVVAHLRDKDQVFNLANFKLAIIAEALNEGWEPDWKNDDEYKYYPWWDMENDNGSGLGLSYTVYGFDGSSSIVGSRLCFKTRGLAAYAGEQFIELYAQAMVIPAKKEEPAK